MKKYFSLLIVLLVLPFLAQASPFRSGTEGVGGGAGMACGRGNQKNFELLEFWESRTLRGQPLLRDDNKSEIEQAREAIQKFIAGAPYFAEEHAQELNVILEHIWNQVAYDKSAFVNASISAPNDTIANLYQSGCQIEGVALYFDSEEKIQLNGQNYTLLTKTGKAGLLVHETIYRFLRKHFQVENSISARGITSCLFTKNSCPELNIYEGIPNTGPLFECTTKEDGKSDKKSFFIFPHAGLAGGQILSAQLRLQFTSNGARPLMTKIYYDLPALAEQGTKYVVSAAKNSITASYAGLRARNSTTLYRNFPVFDNHQEIKIKFATEPSFQKINGINGSLDGVAFACVPHRHQ